MKAVNWALVFALVTQMCVPAATASAGKAQPEAGPEALAPFVAISTV